MLILWCENFGHKRNGKKSYASLLLFLDVTWGVYAMVSPNSRNEKQDSYKYENDEKYEGAKVPNSVAI